jgi:hypothetical protein
MANNIYLFRYAPFVLALYSFGGILALFSSQSMLDEFAPWLPLCVAMGILLSVSVIPWSIRMFLRESRPPRDNLWLVSEDNRPESDVGSMNSNSVQSNRTPYSSLGAFFRQTPNSVEFSHLGTAETLQVYPTTSNEDRASDIDLEEGHIQYFYTGLEETNAGHFLFQSR